jgi:hypothetical protein
MSPSRNQPQGLYNSEPCGAFVCSIQAEAGVLPPFLGQKGLSTAHVCGGAGDLWRGQEGGGGYALVGWALPTTVHQSLGRALLAGPIARGGFP